jgi:hypothetical protein
VNSGTQRFVIEIGSVNTVARFFRTFSVKVAGKFEKFLPLHKSHVKQLIQPPFIAKDTFIKSKKLYIIIWFFIKIIVKIFSGLLSATFCQILPFYGLQFFPAMDNFLGPLLSYLAEISAKVAAQTCTPTSALHVIRKKSLSRGKPKLEAKNCLPCFE